MIERYKSEYFDIKVFIDLYRDVIGSGLKKVKVLIVVFGYEVVKVMFVVGIDKFGFYYLFW